jgi:hypothetical protein
MIDWLINDHGLDLINCVCQIIMALAAVIAICITVKQVSGKSKVHLRATTEFRINERHNHTFYVELILNVVNLGMAPVYMSEVGIQLWDGRREKWKMRISTDPIVIMPGDIAKISGEYDTEMMDDHATLRNKVCVYVKCQLDRFWFEKVKTPYAEFKHESEKVSRNLPN